MSSDHIRVDPASIQSYASAAQSGFSAIRAELTMMIDEVVGVQYSGPNAVSFKTKCGQMVSDFSGKLSVDISKIADAVGVATSNISAALGGARVSISVNGAAVPTPAVPASDGIVDVSTVHLGELIPKVTRHITTITGHLNDHLQRLRSTDWEGNAKDTAVNAVASFTQNALNCANDNGKAISTFIQDQINAVQTADRA